MIHDRIIKRLSDRRDAVPPKPPELWQVHFRGRAIAMSNGKCVWKKIGHVKSALLHELSDLHWGSYAVAKSSREVSAALRDLEACGDIVYVRVV